MAKVEGPQEIPSELLDGYRATLGEVRPDDGVRKRYPYRVPPMQTAVGHPSQNQKKQRSIFNDSVTKFKALSQAERQRWYATMPPWASYLWYYNWFMLNGIPSLWGVVPGGAAILKSIQVVKESVPTTGTKSFTISEVDPAKCVVMIQGSARKVPSITRGSASIAKDGTDQAHGGTIDTNKSTVKLFGASRFYDIEDTSPYGVLVQPYVHALTSSNIHIKWSITPEVAANVSWEITEHVEGVVHPVLVSIAAEAVVIDWAEVPDAAAYVTITVIEYI